MSEAQASLERFFTRATGAGQKGGPPLGALAATEPLLALPVPPYPATLARTGLGDADA
jgi:hypothetical protein